MTDVINYVALAQPQLHDPAWVVYARSKLGEHEISGDLDNDFIVQCLREAGLPANMQHDETSWCGAFAAKCMFESGIKPPAWPAAARNWRDFGIELVEPVHGCIMVYTRPPDESHGHVGFYDALVPRVISYPFWDTLGGNENNQVMTKPYAKKRLLSPRWPEGVWMPDGCIPLKKVA